MNHCTVLSLFLQCCGTCIRLCHVISAVRCRHYFLFPAQNDDVGSIAWYGVTQTGTGNVCMLAIR